MTLHASPGQPFPLGASLRPDGANFAVYSPNSHALDLCLFDNTNPQRETQRIRFLSRTREVWHVFVPGLKADTLYALRAHGPCDPDNGLRFNPHKLLLDPYARALSGPVNGHPDLLGHHQDGSLHTTDSNTLLPRCILVDGNFNWEDDQHPRTPLEETIIYETHVRGLTIQHPDVPEKCRGTYAGVACDPIIRHLKDLGVTAVQLLPVHQHINDGFLLQRDLSNYWGYQSIAFFAPNRRYAANQQAGACVREFKEMVRSLHRAGIEVILDVVYNHTGEGNEHGPTIHFKGLANDDYYRLARLERTRYHDFTGTGNTTDIRQPRILQLILDSLRYWVEEMHVDGFRYDLAATLGRESDDFSRNAAFFRALQQDPVLSTVKHIAEPWDIGWGGYNLGNFPSIFSELNGRFRDDCRRFWKGDQGTLPDIASRLTGSEDIFGSENIFARDKTPLHSVNFITSHDGFTLRDLVSYNEKHNEANGEDNKDGESHNNSWNCGHEGPTDDKDINALRLRQQRNLLATVILSQGIPFLLGGDEIHRSQKGNNNAYCQDNPVSWFDWSPDPEKQQLTDFIARLTALRRENHVFSRRHFLHGNTLHGSTARDILWLHPHGRAMTADDWRHPAQLTIGVLLVGSSRSRKIEWRASQHGNSFLLLLNAEPEPQTFTLPGKARVKWQTVMDTSQTNPFPQPPPKPLDSGTHINAPERSFLILQLTHGTEKQAIHLPGEQ